MSNLNFKNETLNSLWQTLVERTEAICGTLPSITDKDGVSRKDVGIKAIHDALINHFNLTRDTEPKTPGDYMKGIAVCSRYHVNRTIDTESNQTLEEIVTNLEEACTHPSKWRGSCTDLGGGTHQVEFHCDDCGASWTESEEHYFLNGSCDYCGAYDEDYDGGYDGPGSDEEPALIECPVCLQTYWSNEGHDCPGYKGEEEEIWCLNCGWVTTTTGRCPYCYPSI